MKPSKDSVQKGKKKFYLSEFSAEAKISIRQAEDFFVPLLQQSKLKGKLEVRCPCCGKDVEVYDRLSQVPEKIECEICSCEFSKQPEYFEIILEVVDNFFRDQKCVSNIKNRSSY